jgi:hypothetical protein
MELGLRHALWQVRVLPQLRPLVLLAAVWTRCKPEVRAFGPTAAKLRASCVYLLKRGWPRLEAVGLRPTLCPRRGRFAAVSRRLTLRDTPAAAAPAVSAATTSAAAE